jgi:hypothetical protein
MYLRHGSRGTIPRPALRATFPTRGKEEMCETDSGFGMMSPHRIVGMENCAPSLMPDGQREVTVLVRV